MKKILLLFVVLLISCDSGDTQYEHPEADLSFVGRFTHIPEDDLAALHGVNLVHRGFANGSFDKYYMVYVITGIYNPYVLNCQLREQNKLTCDEDGDPSTSDEFTGMVLSLHNNNTELRITGLGVADGKIFLKE